ncbi:MAG: quinohemoprotein amine dehydrogenase subunit alpha [Gammaproteobacteria bacterium]|nr:quinohemoprotein amine dehydrogenase subunit alpha [Gammaproteobacteria bacterium]MDH3464920.1 quinohemoprotein amine dehydrogenase subunit alpha [Gammaproteobacteria bacterium]
MKNRVLCALFLGLSGVFFALVASAQQSGQALLESKCGSCHTRTDDGLERIKDSRRTPEGWDMNIVRMMLIHGVKVTGEERAALVKYLADTRGLAPAETADRRYLLERRSNMVEDQPDETLAVMCARCHTYGRFALQRRTEGEWLKLSHFHMGQFPTIEYQNLGRDRNWWEIAKNDVPPLLAQNYPLETQAWSEWQSHAAHDLSGAWRLTGSQPGRGVYHGAMTFNKSGDDTYSISLNMQYADGSSVKGSGSAIVYTGYEVRGSVELDGQTVHQVYALTPDGDSMSGRWYLRDNDVIGGDLSAVRNDAQAHVLAVQPRYLKTGETAHIAIHGTGLAGNVSFGDGVEIMEIVAASADTITVKAHVGDGAVPGQRSASVGSVRMDDAFVVYSTIDSIRVEPENAIARVGGDGPLAPVPAQFDAVAYLNGADGKAGTNDDVRVGVMPATWSVENNSEAAAALEDTKFAGSIDASTGLFVAAGAGPNSQRPFSTNNAGDLSVKAVVTSGGSAFEGSAHLVVTVQRWNDPPLR